MKKLMIIIALIIVASMTMAASTNWLVGTRYIHFTNYCDGLKMNFDGTQYFGGNRTGCVSDWLLGTQATGSYSISFDPAMVPPGIHTLVKSDHTWVHFVTNGAGGYDIWNSGTWHNGLPALDSNAPSSFQK